jgi:hypothetical protein
VRCRCVEKLAHRAKLLAQYLCAFPAVSASKSTWILRRYRLLSRLEHSPCAPRLPSPTTYLVSLFTGAQAAGRGYDPPRKGLPLKELGEAMNTAIKWLRHCCQRMAKGWIFTAVGLLTLFFAHPHLAYACKYQNINNAPCPYDCKEGGGEVACLAPIPVPYTANTLTDKRQWQYGNSCFPRNRV